MHRLEFKCKLCSFKTIFKQRYSNHIQIHKDQNPNKAKEVLHCNECNFKTKLKMKLKRHKKEIHDEDNIKVTI